MKKIYSHPEVECTPVNTKELMQNISASVGGGANQNEFNAPRRGGEIID